jgi:CMP-N-acetylneuraminic acid synthetase
MIKGLKVLAIIPARGGSKGIPRKNLKSVGGKSLLAWTSDEAKHSKYIDRLVLSSEDPEIINESKKIGLDVPFVRPTDLAMDTTPGVDPVIHAIQMLPGYDIIILLQLTSPLRTVEDIDGALELMVEKNAPALVSVTEANKSPYWMVSITDDGLMKPVINTDLPITRRQDLPKAYSLNGAIFISKPDFLIEKKTYLTPETQVFVMPQNRSIDLDTELDFKILDILLREKNF